MNIKFSIILLKNQNQGGNTDCKRVEVNQQQYLVIIIRTMKFNNN